MHLLLWILPLLLLPYGYSHYAIGTKKYEFTQEELYDSCASDSGIICYGAEKATKYTNIDCIKNRNCDVIVKIFSDDTDNRYFRVRFQLMGKPWGPVGPYEDRRYIAVGISTDRKMGNDSVIECRSHSEKVFSSWNAGTANNLEFVPGDEPVHYYHTNWIMEKDGIVYCDFYRDALSVVQEHIFDLTHNSEEKYHILIAKGETEFKYGITRLKRHNLANASLTPILSAKAITIPSRIPQSPNSSNIIIIHGNIISVFMILLILI